MGIDDQLMGGEGEKESEVGGGKGKSSFRQKCKHLAKKQRAKFYILRRCIAMLVCWHERNDPKEEED